MRGKFGRYAHDKILIVSDTAAPQKVLTGSTNFSVTGLYVNANHVLVFNDPEVAAKYADVFDAVWAGGASSAPAFLGSPLASETFDASRADARRPRSRSRRTRRHSPTEILDGVVAPRSGRRRRSRRQRAVRGHGDRHGDQPGLRRAQRAARRPERSSATASPTVPPGISLYAPGQKTGVLVTGKPTRRSCRRRSTRCPVSGSGTRSTTSSSSAASTATTPSSTAARRTSRSAARSSNGDNLLAIHDRDVATAFAIEALALVDHFQFLDRFAQPQGGRRSRRLRRRRPRGGASRRLVPLDDRRWAKPYFDPDDLHCVDRQLFAG